MIMDRETLKDAVRVAVTQLGGESSIVDVAKYIWDFHEADLKASGDLFYTWQYVMRWAAQSLRDEGKLTFEKRGRSNVWRKV